MFQMARAAVNHQLLRGQNFYNMENEKYANKVFTQYAENRNKQIAKNQETTRNLKYRGKYKDNF